MTDALQGWQPDPFRRHELRYFSAGVPTYLVRDGAVESSDPLVEPIAPPRVEARPADQFSVDRTRPVEPAPEPAPAPWAAPSPSATETMLVEGSGPTLGYQPAPNYGMPYGYGVPAPAYGVPYGYGPPGYGTPPGYPPMAGYPQAPANYAQASVAGFAPPPGYAPQFAGAPVPTSPRVTDLGSTPSTIAADQSVAQAATAGTNEPVSSIAPAAPDEPSAETDRATVLTEPAEPTEPTESTATAERIEPFPPTTDPAPTPPPPIGQPTGITLPSPDAPMFAIPLYALVVYALPPITAPGQAVLPPTVPSTSASASTSAPSTSAPAAGSVGTATTQAQVPPLSQLPQLSPWPLPDLSVPPQATYVSSPAYSSNGSSTYASPNGSGVSLIDQPRVGSLAQTLRTTTFFDPQPAEAPTRATTTAGPTMTPPALPPEYGLPRTQTTTASAAADSLDRRSAVSSRDTMPSESRRWLWFAASALAAIVVIVVAGLIIH